MAARPAVSILTTGMLETAAETLAEAFLDDPMFIWLFPDEDTRRSRLLRMNRVPLEFGLRYARVSQTDQGRGVAIWLPPGVTLTPTRMVRSGMLGVPMATGLRPLARFAAANGVMEKVKARAVSAPYWQLLIVAVHPDLQGRGCGRALVSDGLEQVDKAALTSYLDTSKPSNIGFYQGLGFEVVEEAVLGQEGPPAWGMRRNPVATDSA
jgi:ribosomal protein S18 acetylase RimI-like enzyme